MVEYFFATVMLANVIIWLVDHIRRLRDVERKINLLLSHFAIDPNASVAPSSQVLSLASDPARRIEAIKAYRAQTGAGLKEAAAVIDRIASGRSEVGS